MPDWITRFPGTREGKGNGSVFLLVPKVLRFLYRVMQGKSGS